MAWRFATRIGAIRANRLAEKKTWFSEKKVPANRVNRLKPAIRNVHVPQNAIRNKKGFSSGSLTWAASIRHLM